MFAIPKVLQGDPGWRSSSQLFRNIARPLSPVLSASAPWKGSIKQCECAKAAVGKVAGQGQAFNGILLPHHYSEFPDCCCSPNRFIKAKTKGGWSESRQQASDDLLCSPGLVWQHLAWAVRLGSRRMPEMWGQRGVDDHGVDPPTPHELY